MPSNILIVAIAFPPDPITGAARPGRFAKYLPQFGYRAEVIAGSASVRENTASVRRVPHAEPAWGDRLAYRAADMLQRRLLPYNDSVPWATAAFREARRLYQSTGPLPVISSSPPLGCHLAGLRLKRRYGVPWIADFRDPLLGNPFRTRRWFFPCDPWAEKLIFEHADAIVANTDAVADSWKSRYPMFEKKIELIWNGFDPQQPIQPEPLPPRPYRILAHVGSLYGGRHPAILIRSLDRLIRASRLQPSSLRLQLIGPVDDNVRESQRMVFDALAAHGCLDMSAGTVSPKQALEASATADYLLLLDLNEQNTKLQVPAKLFEYIRIGRPILAFTGRESPVERILSRSGILFRCIAPDTPEGEVDQIVGDFLALPTDPRSPSDWFNDTFNGISQTRHLAEILNRVGACAHV
jgi:hypothetical protein